MKNTKLITVRMDYTWLCNYQRIQVFCSENNFGGYNQYFSQSKSAYFTSDSF